MNSKKTFTTDRLEKIMASALNKRSLNQTQSLNFAKYPAYKLNAQKASSPIKKYLPYSLNYKNFEKAILFVALTILFSTVGTPDAFATASLRRANPMAALASLQERMQQTEAGAGAEVCTDCASRSPQSSLSNYLSQLPIVRDGFARVQNATYFEDEDHKSAVVDLRARRESGERLTQEELAILQAANRTGFFRFPDCANSNGRALNGNAFLVQINGRDAIITSAHMAADINTGRIHNGCSPEQLARVEYYPNMSYMNTGSNLPYPGAGDPILEVVTGSLATDIGGLNNSRIDVPDDFIVVYLDQQISNQPSIDGQTRGAFQFAETNSAMHRTVMLGFDSVFTQNTGRHTMTYQDCSLQNIADTTFNSCDSAPGTSGSVITVLQDGELRFHSLHSGSNPVLRNYETTQPLPVSTMRWNLATPAKNIEAALRLTQRPGTDS